MRTKTRFASQLLATTIFCGALGLAAPAYAQDEDQGELPQTGPAPAVAQEEGDQNIVITGSRIPQPNLTNTSPVTVVNSQEVRMTGTTRAEDLINSLPQAFAAQGANVSNAATGTASLNLRGLGSTRTLVLVNGRRLMPGSPNQLSAAADINIIPAFMIDRVDVLTGGASSVYGADAVAGVVNFVMDTDFEGIRLDTQYSFYQHNNDAGPNVTEALDAAGFTYPRGNVTDGGTWDFGIAFGVGFDDGRGHITAYAGYRDINPVLQGRRDYSACSLDANSAEDTATLGREFECGGSATSDVGTIFTNDGTFQIGPGRTFLPGSTLYNFGPLNYFQRPDERYVAGLFADYEISPALRPYMEFMFMDDRTVAQIAPSGTFFETSTINCDNPLLSAQQLAIVCATENLVGYAEDDPETPEDESSAPTVFTDALGNTYNQGVAFVGRRNIEGGGRQDNLQHTSYRILGGMRGELSDVWSYDFSYQFGRVNFVQSYQNDFSIVRIGRALDVVTDPATGQPVCRSFLDGTDTACLPYDVWALDSVNPAAAAYLAQPLLQRGFTEETVASASLTGDLSGWGLQFPWANSGVGVAVGLEYRKERLGTIPDSAFQSGDGAGQGGPTLPVNGSYDVREAFAELRVPIVEDSFIHELSLELGYRYSDYGVLDRSFSTDTYKIAGFFSPIPDIRFRGGYNRAVRAPNIQELFAPTRVVLDGTEDPCAGDFDPTTAAGPPTASQAQCAFTGVTAGQYGNIAPNPASQYNGQLGGSVTLEPEVADTITLGVVFQPRFLPRFALTVDWFDIQIDNAIQPLGADNIINSCLESGDAFFCDRINRAPNGSLWLSSNGYIVDLNENIGGVSTRGIDIGASYSMDVGTFGNLGFNFQGTWLDKLVTDQGFGVVFDCVGFYGNQCSANGPPNPEWRHTARVSWTHPDGYGASLRWRYIGSTRVDDLSDDPDLAGGNTQPGHDRLRAMNYLDLSLNFRVGDNYAFRLGVNNLLDSSPPLTGQQVCPAGPCNGNTWAQAYDALGRYLFAGVTLDF